MSTANFDQSLKLVLCHEGGFVNNPKDPGGATNKGVTQAVYNAYNRNAGLPSQSVRLINDAEVHSIYESRYWKLVSADKLPAGIDYALFDYAVNSGPGKAVRDLQRTLVALGHAIPVDGMIGDDTVTAVENSNQVELIENLCQRRLAFMRSLKTWGTFGKGWKRRVEGDYDGVQDGDKGVVDFAAHMAKTNQAVAHVDLPAPIGAKTGENSGKASLGAVSVIKTARGIGAALAGAGVTGQVAMTAAGTVKEHIDGTIIGQVALILFVLLIIAGVGLVLFKYVEDQREKAG